MDDENQIRLWPDDRDATEPQELNSVSELTALLESTEGVFDSTDSISARLPSPPAHSPDLAVKADDSGPVSATNVVDSISSRTSLDSYVWSSASSDLPSWSLREDEEKLIWPLKDEFSITDDFEENKHYQRSKIIGFGAYGICYLATEVPANDAIPGREFCVKVCRYRKNEILALQLAKKDNIAEIVGFYGAKIKGRSVSIFMEYIAGGTLADLIKMRKKSSNANWPVISEEECLGFLEDVLKAVNFLHSKGIVHKDIKGENVLLKANHLDAKLTDFGSAESSKDASPSGDIWKIGCLLLKMLNGERSPLHCINEGSFQRPTSCKPKDYIPSNAMQETKEVLQFCFGLKTTDENYLPSAAEVLKHSNAFPVKELLKRLKPFGEQVPGSESFS